MESSSAASNRILELERTIRELCEFAPVPEYFEPHPTEAGWMRGSNSVGLQGGRWTTRENFDHIQNAALRALLTEHASGSGKETK